jgi:hypothetical protein
MPNTFQVKELNPGYIESGIYKWAELLLGIACSQVSQPPACLWIWIWSASPDLQASADSVARSTSIECTSGWKKMNKWICTPSALCGKLTYWFCQVYLENIQYWKSICCFWSMNWIFLVIPTNSSPNRKNISYSSLIKIKNDSIYIKTWEVYLKQ